MMTAAEIAALMERMQQVNIRVSKVAEYGDSEATALAREIDENLHQAFRKSALLRNRLHDLCGM